MLDKLERFNYIKIIDDSEMVYRSNGDILEIENKERKGTLFLTANGGYWSIESEKKTWVFVTDKYAEKNKDRLC